MKPSAPAQVQQLYEDWADSYATMMDAEIDLPVYADTLGRLAERIADLTGSVIDTSCGPGHMLSRYHERHDPARALVGIDLAPRMAALASARLESSAEILTGDMRDLRGVESGSAAAVVSFFAIHHLDPEDVLVALREWHRALRPGGQLLVAAWEGVGPVDYGDDADVVALRYTKDEVTSWAEQAGFVVNRCVVEPAEGMPMQVVYLEATQQTRGGFAQRR